MTRDERYIFRAFSSFCRPSTPSFDSNKDTSIYEFYDWDILIYIKIIKTYNVELAIKNQGAIIIFQVHHHDFRGKQILITFSKALIKFAIDMLYYYFFWPKTPSRNNKLLKNQVAIKKIFFWAIIFF